MYYVKNTYHLFFQLRGGTSRCAVRTPIRSLCSPPSGPPSSCNPPCPTRGRVGTGACCGIEKNLAVSTCSSQRSTDIKVSGCTKFRVSMRTRACPHSAACSESSSICIVTYSCSTTNHAFFADDMVKVAREQSCTWWAPSAAQDRREGTLRVRRQREDGSGLGNLHDGLAAEGSNASSCTYTRAVGCSLRGSAQILQLKERCVILKSVREVLLDHG